MKHDSESTSERKNEFRILEESLFIKTVKIEEFFKKIGEVLEKFMNFERKRAICHTASFTLRILDEIIINRQYKSFLPSLINKKAFM